MSDNPPVAPVAAAPAIKETDIYDAAKAEAQSRAPLPTRDPIETGFFGAMIAVGVLFLFCIISGINTETVEIPIGITVICSFIIPWGALKYQERKHYQACAEAYTRIQAERARNQES
jgi:hypothetical protein